MKYKELIIKELKQIPEADEVELYAHDRDTEHKAIVDRISMDTICVVPAKNQIIQHKNVWEEVTNLKNYVIKGSRLLYSGRVLMVDLTEREPKKVELLPDDFIECGAIITNDYGKTRGLGVQGVANRLVCNNGMVAPNVNRKMQIYAYGTEDFSKEMEDQINASMDSWIMENFNIFQKASETIVSTKDIIEEHSFLPKKYMKIVTEKLENEQSLFDIYGVYTEVISHQVAPNAQVDYTLSLQKRANKILTQD